MNKQCTDIIKKIKIATGKVLKYAQTFKQQRAMHYRQQVTLTIWKAIVLVDSTTNSILLTSIQQIQRVQIALDKSLAECMGLSDSPILQTPLNADCGLLPTRLQQAIKVCSLHVKLLEANQNWPAAQIHKSLISAPLSNNLFKQSVCFSTLQRFREPNRTLVSKNDDEPFGWGSQKDA